MNASWQLRPDWASGRIECNSSASLSAPPWVVIPFEWLFGLALAGMPLYALLRAYPRLMLPDYIVPLLFLLFLFVSREVLISASTDLVL